jgi:DNA-binding PadR family transcriptional regulator
MALSSQVFHILLALADRNRHGYGIMQEVEERTNGEVRLGPGTLYGAIKRLLADGLIEELEGGDDDERRRLYRLTPGGRRAVRAEAGRLEQLVSAARAKRVVPSRRGA